jgi:prevent-host-death family protein
MSSAWGEAKANPSRVTERHEIELQDQVANSDSNDKMYILLYINGVTTMAETKVSVAEARQHFARLIKRAQQGKTIEITRRGEPVAVLLSASEYSAIIGERSSFIDAMRKVRERLGVDELEIGDAEFEGLREESPGREISL